MRPPLHEQIFDATVPDVFFAPLHSAPLDLLSPCFYRTRQPAIDERLALVAAAPPTHLAEMAREDPNPNPDPSPNPNPNPSPNPNSNPNPNPNPSPNPYKVREAHRKHYGKAMSFVRWDAQGGYAHLVHLQQVAVEVSVVL